MNIVFNTLRYKNLLSTGNVFTEISLDKSKTTLISGSNGAGKSTLIDAITFVLYGKAHRKINKPQLINTINQKDLLVEIEFTIGKNRYHIKRGLKPNIFEIWCNGEMLNKDAASKDYQAYLEQNILKLNFKSFSQIVILGSATYIPFMELPVGQRREIIEDLLDIQIFSTMNLLLKERVSENKSSITENEYKLELTKSNIKMAEENSESIRKLKLIELDKIKEKAKTHLQNIEENNSKISELEEKISALLKTIDHKTNTRKKRESYKELEYDLDSKMTAFIKELTFYHDHDNCPTCKQGIEHDFKLNIVGEKEQKKLEIESGLEKIKVKLKELDDELNKISDVEDKIQKLQLKAGEHRADIRSSKSALASYKDEIKSAEKEVDEIDSSRVEEYKKELKTIQKDQEKLFEEKETLGVAGSMLKDGGIKTRIIKQYIPVMNTLINKYLSDFELFVDFHLDESFNEVIKSRFRDAFSYSSFSEGEKMRINLSILFTWRAVSKLRNSISTNILILDEVLDSGSDSEGVNSLIEILNNNKNKENVFVISHRGDAFTERFESNIKFKKDRNFSVIDR